MGLELTIQSLSQAEWPGTSGQEKTDPRSAQGRSRNYNPAEAKTPEDAQACIEWLYKTGRTDELVALLRRSSIFRVAWQSLQESSPSISKALGELVSPPVAEEGSGLPAPLPGAGSAGRQLNPVQNLELRATQEANPETRTYPVLSSRPTNSLAAGRRVYETQARDYSQGSGNFSRINLRI